MISVAVAHGCCPALHQLCTVHAADYDSTLIRFGPTYAPMSQSGVVSSDTSICRCRLEQPLLVVPSCASRAQHICLTLTPTRTWAARGALPPGQDSPEPINPACLSLTMSAQMWVRR